MSDITKPNDISMVNDVPPMPQFSEHQHGPYIVTEWMLSYKNSESLSDFEYAKIMREAIPFNKHVAIKVRCAICLKETEL